MSLQEEHQALHRRGEMLKFLLLLLALVGTVLLIALLRPLIFERIVPSVLGLNQPAEEPAPVVVPSLSPSPADGEETLPPIMTPTPPPESEPAGGADAISGETGSEAAPTAQIYEVQRGDTMAAIAERFGVSLQTLIQVNNIANPNRIQPGDRLTIPTP